MDELLAVLLMFLPLLVILWLANLAEGQRARGQAEAARVLAVVSYLAVALLYGALIALGALLHGLGLAAQADRVLMDSLRDSEAALGIAPAALPRVGLGMWLPSVLGVLLLLPTVRRLAARLIPIDAGNTVHAVVLSCSMLVLVNLLVTMGFGIGNLARIIESSGQDAPQMVVTLWVQELTWLVMAVVGVGWLSRRSLAGSLQRLGMVVPGRGQAVTGLVIGVLAAGVILALEYLIGKAGVSAGADVEKLTEQLIGPLTESAFGILTLGLAAALGEEALFRGALQPRFGLLLTSLLFALMHSTYGLTVATLFVFAVGLLLGLVRRRANTTASMIVHATYNMTLGIISYVGWLQNM